MEFGGGDGEETITLHYPTSEEELSGGSNAGAGGGGNMEDNSVDSTPPPPSLSDQSYSSYVSQLCPHLAVTELPEVSFEEQTEDKTKLVTMRSQVG